MEEEAKNVQLEKLAVEEENRQLRETNFELQSKTQADANTIKALQTKMADKDKQLKIMTDQNTELLRLLETEEAQTSKLNAENRSLREEVDAIRTKYSSLLASAKQHEELAAVAAREGQLRADELRLLRAEAEQLRQQNTDMKRKSQVEIESLQEQLRVRKEKQYHLLERTQAAEEAKRQAEDQVSSMEEKLRQVYAKTVELETQLQVEARAKRSQMEANKKLKSEEENLRAANADLQAKIERAESERLRMEAEARDSGDQLREMAEKVFQLLERLKLAELGKTKAVEALRTKEQEVMALKKKNSRLLKESAKEGKARVKAELDKKVLVDQIRALKKHNTQLAVRSREEVKAKLKEHEERKAAQEKVRTLSNRMSFLLNKLQADEEAKVVQREEMKKMEAQIRTLKERNEEMADKLNRTGESNRVLTQALRLKQEEFETLSIKYEALLRQMQSQEEEDALGAGPIAQQREAAEPDNSAVRDSGGRGRFYVETKPTQGFLLIKGARGTAKDLVDRLEINKFLKRAQKGHHFKEMVVEKVSHLLGLLLVEEEEREARKGEHAERAEQLRHLERVIHHLQQRLQAEEEAKRRTLLRYVHAVKAAADANAAAASAGAVHVDASVAGGVVQLAESEVGDEEMHALAAMLQNNPSITELNVRMNSVTDEGARALAAVLAGNSSLRTVDLRENHVGKSGVRAIAEALERSQRVRHVYVHAGGKIEALGTGMWAAPRGQGGEPAAGGTAGAPGGGMMTVETVCAVDVRDNTEAPRTDEMGMDGGTFGLTSGRPGTRGTSRPGPRSPLRPETDETGRGGGLNATSKSQKQGKRSTKRAPSKRKPKDSKQQKAERDARREYKRMVRGGRCVCMSPNIPPPALTVACADRATGA